MNNDYSRMKIAVIQAAVTFGSLGFLFGCITAFASCAPADHYTSTTHISTDQ